MDVVKEYGTTKGFSEMHGLYSIGGNAVNLWRDWMNNDGQYLDPKSVKLTPEQILDNWNRFLSIIDQHISSPRKEVLLNFYKQYEERFCLMPASNKREYHF